MVLVTTNKVKQLVHLSFIDHVTAEQIRNAEKDLQSLVAEMTPGFCLLTDLERLESMTFDCAEEIGRMMDFFLKAGVERVVRIIPKPERDIGLNILSVFHYGRNVRPITCQTIVEAAKVLGL